MPLLSQILTNFQKEETVRHLDAHHLRQRRFHQVRDPSNAHCTLLDHEHH